MADIINYCNITAVYSILQLCQDFKMHLYIRVSHLLLRTGIAIGAPRLLAGFCPAAKAALMQFRTHFLSWFFLFYCENPRGRYVRNDRTGTAGCYRHMPP